MAEYPRVYVSKKTHARIKRAAKKQNVTQKELGEKVAVAGLNALGL